MAGTLFLVSTPIGNLEDITLRALRVLREATVIAAEDTRRTARLLTHHGISTPSTSFHEHNVKTRVPQLLARLERGESVAVVTDAGTPSVSDPGLELVQACVEHGIDVDPIPGPSAPLAAAAASGFPLSPWTIYAFPPTRGKDRKRWFLEVSGVKHTVSFFEAPHRVKATLDEMAEYLVNRPIMVARELTKAHQEFLRGTVSQVSAALGSPRGEFTIVIGPEKAEERQAVPASDATLASEFSQLTETSGIGRRAAISEIAKRHQRPAREVYAALERSKNLAGDQ
jgi:16S rRNA (cytidine1402-2'-O)-methyltransferase